MHHTHKHIRNPFVCSLYSSTSTSLSSSSFSFFFQLNVAVYYESLCPDSARFIVEQVQPLMRGPLGKYVDVTLVPFGKANVSVHIELLTCSMNIYIYIQNPWIVCAALGCVKRLVACILFIGSRIGVESRQSFARCQQYVTR